MSKEFGQLLKKYREQSIDPLYQKRLTQERFAELLEKKAGLPGFSHATISHWESGRHPIRPNDRHILVGISSVLYQCGGIKSLDEAQELLFVGNYRALINEEIDQIEPDWLNDTETSTAETQTESTYKTNLSFDSDNSIVKVEGDFIAGDNHKTYHGPVIQSNTGNITVISLISISAIKIWFANYFRWHEADEHAQSSWAGMVIYSLSAIGDRYSKSVLLYCGGLTIWVIAAWLITPILQWPLADPRVRWAACSKLAAGLISIPMVIALLTTPDNDELFKPESWQQKATLFFLKFSGALVSFFLFTTLLIFSALIWYYLALPSMGVWIWHMLILVPLVMSHVSARRIPVDRYKMFAGVLKSHSADHLFTAVFCGAALLMPAFIFYWYAFLAERMTALFILLLITSMAFWQNRHEG